MPELRTRPINAVMSWIGVSVMLISAVWFLACIGWISSLTVFEYDESRGTTLALTWTSVFVFLAGVLVLGFAFKRKRLGKHLAKDPRWVMGGVGAATVAWILMFAWVIYFSTVDSFAFVNDNDRILLLGFIAAGLTFLPSALTIVGLVRKPKTGKGSKPGKRRSVK